MRSRRWRNLLCCPQLTLGNSTSEPKKPVAGAQRQTTFSGATADADVYSQRAEWSPLTANEKLMPMPK
jgi:hypothetical protein